MYAVKMSVANTPITIAAGEQYSQIYYRRWKNAHIASYKHFSTSQS